MRPLAAALGLLLAVAGTAHAGVPGVDAPGAPLDASLVTIECMFEMPLTGVCLVYCVNVADLICVPV